MASVFFIDGNGTRTYYQSVHSPEYQGLPNAVLNPDMSAFTNTPLKFLKIVNGVVVEMTQGEKDTVTANEIAARKAFADTFDIQLRDFATALIKVINIRLTAGQKITKAEMITAIKEEIL